MSGAERIDIASAQLAGINESIDCLNFHAEPSGKNQLHNHENVQNVPSMYFDSSGEREPVYPNSFLSEAAEDGGSIADWDMRKYLGESLNPIETVGDGLGMLDNKFQACESAGMGIGISNCSTSQQFGDGFICANAGTEQLLVQDVESLTCQSEEDGTRRLNYGNVETMGNSLGLIGTVGEQLHMDDSERSYGPGEDCSRPSTLQIDEKPGESFHTCVLVEGGNQVSTCDVTTQAEESVSLMQTAIEELELCHESQTCEPSALQNLFDQESAKSELSDPNAVLPNMVVPELVTEGLIPVENDVELPCHLNFQNEFGNENFSNQSLIENIGTQLQNDTIAQGNPAKNSWNNRGSVSVDSSLNKPVQTSDVLSSCTFSVTAANSSRVEEAPEIIEESNHASARSEQSEQKEKGASEAAPDNTKEKQNTEFRLNVIESAPVDGAHRSLFEEMEKSHHFMSKCSGRIKQNPPAAYDAKDGPSEQTVPLSEEITEKMHVVVCGIPANSTIESARRGQKQGKTSAVSIEKKYALRSSVDCSTASHSRSQGNPKTPQPIANVENTKGSTSRSGRKQKMEMRGKSHDEFARMRKHLRYLLHKIQCEQHLLDAYSSEGWRGQSVEKLRPEKELQRAKADINRSKLKIRDLFQRLDSMSAEGKFPDSLFDSEGLIDSEDIFCAKCGTKDLSPHNDIILCDGACDRGFHQYCLEPPLRTEEIPPGDQSWLCPACECKVDCLDVLNDTQETRVSIEDSWEKVFPEAAAAVIGSEHDNIMGLPSDDSEDNDYNPDGTDDNVKVEGSESSSDESDSAESDSSDFSSASEDLGPICGSEQYLGLPSDDSEDDDYDPDAPNVTEDVEHESSSSDTSASEDLGAAVDNNGTTGNQPPPLFEQDQDMGDSPSVSGRRPVERLDYKKLYDEAYGNAASDSSDDEEWTDADSTRKRKGSAKKGVSVSSNADASVLTGGTVTDNVGTPRKSGWKKLNSQATSGSPAQLTKSSRKIGSSAKSVKRPPCNRLGEVVIQKMYDSFKENHYPDRETKEKLAKELGLTPQRVDKWFGHARWRFNHRPGRLEASMAAAASRSNTAPTVACNQAESASADASTALSQNGSSDLSKLDTRRTSTPKKSRKRKKTEDYQPILQSLNTDTSMEGTQTDALQTAEAQHGARRSRRKSGS